MIATAKALQIRPAGQGHSHPHHQFSWPGLGQSNLLNSHIFLAVKHGCRHHLQPGR
jgi:hypothetical protein